MSYHRVKCGLCVATVSLSLAACSDVPSTSMAEKGALTETVFAPTLPNAKASSATLVRQSLARIDAIDRDGPTLQSVLSINPDAIAIAEALDAERADGRNGPIFARKLP